MVYLVCAVTVVALTMALTRRGHIGWNDAAFGALVGAFPNTGFMGVPLLVALLGAAAAGPAIVTQQNSTTVIPRGYTAQVKRLGDIVISRSTEGN